MADVAASEFDPDWTMPDMLNTARETSTEAFLEPGFRPSPPVVRPG